MGQINNQIIIPLSRTKIILSLLGSILFVFLGVCFVNNPEKFISIVCRNENFIRIVGLAGILFFGLCFAFYVRKVFDFSPGLTIDESGLIDNSSAVAAGKILWSDINDISVIEIKKKKIIMIQVKNPNDYIDRQAFGFKRKLMKINHSMYGTPISLTANGLRMTFDELRKTIMDSKERYK
jgi:hypothetical protein